MNNELTVIEFEPIVKQSGLEKAEQYAAVFAPFMITLKQLSDKASTINHSEPSVLDAKLAREVRLAMAKNRTASEKIKDTNKASLLAEGNLIQNLYNVIANSSKLSEADLDAVEKYAENKEKERKAQLATERAAMFSEYGTDLTGYDLGGMADNVFADLLESQKLLHEKRIADATRAEAERIAAEKAELERQAALKAENERLKKEAEVKDKRNAELLPYIQFIRDYNKLLLLPEDDYKKEFSEIKKGAKDHWEFERKEQLRQQKEAADKELALQKERAENDAKLADIEAENKRVRDKAAAELKASQDAADKVAKQLQDIKDAEIKAAADKLAAEKKAAKAPVKEKLKTAVKLLDLVLPESEISVDILAKFNDFKSWALQQIEAL